MAEKKSRNIGGFEHIPYFPRAYPQEEMDQRSSWFYDFANQRRSVRHFSEKPVSRGILENIVKAAGTAPSGANKQPWTFCLVGNPDIKKRIREAAEKEEYENYASRMSQEWLDDLKKIGTDWQKPFLGTAPWLIVVFRRIYEVGEKGEKKNNYYVTESIGLACGILLMAIQHAGLVALTHTPSPMNFLIEILQRPENERPFLLIPVGHAADETYVPDIERKKLKEICVVYE
ncbi:MAG: nitroreductase family protein [Cyclobacteriaceae bacterium]|nr:nitroreductase family protein [Cyclobacteriaceae bacterium]